MNHVARDHQDAVTLGMDVHRDSISTAVADGDGAEVRTDRIPHDEACVRRFLRQYEGRRVRGCYEAGSTGYELARLLDSLGVDCEVIAPSLIPAVSGSRVKTDKRDAVRLCRLYRAGELTAIRIPTVAEEAVRDLCRARDDAVIDRNRARQRIGKFLLRHGRIWRSGRAWTFKHEQWLRAQHFDERALQTTFDHYLAQVDARDATVTAIDADLALWYDRQPFAGAIARLSCYRGITELGALTLASEVCDWRRFPSAGLFMAFCGLTPSEYSSGNRTSRGHITHAGNVHVRTQLVESAWAYQHRPAVGAVLRHRQDGAHPATVARAWTAQERLTRRFRRMTRQNKNRNIIATAVARELAGFVWAEMTAD